MSTLQELDETLGGSGQEQALISASREGTCYMHRLSCGVPTEQFQKAPANLLAARGFKWAPCCKGGSE